VPGGLALLFTPLFTAGLGAVKPELYSHGSAIIGTVQQVAGAVGTALFVTVMSIQSAALAADGSAGTVAVAGGVRAAFLAGAIISVFAVAAAFFVRKPADNQAAGHESANQQATDGETASPAESAGALADGR
jgi:DHA2 family lincomycin resistance protein-like MFS transporter